MGYILYEKKGHIGYITINRPEALNALNTDVLKELEQVIYGIETDKDVRVAIVTGQGKAFVAGADIAQMCEMTVEQAYDFANTGNRVFTKLERLEVPVICAINGYALGGGLELALSCDMRIASEKAKFGQPETGLGITPGFGGTQRLSRVVGMSRAMELILTGKTIGSKEAADINLVNKVVSPEELITEAEKLANQIANNAPVAVKEAKKAIRQFWCADVYMDLIYEAGAFSRCFATKDQKAGMAAFLEKKPHDEYTGE